MYLAGVFFLTEFSLNEKLRLHILQQFLHVYDVYKTELLWVFKLFILNILNDEWIAPTLYSVKIRREIMTVLFPSHKKKPGLILYYT
jgi:hypothetical protein